MEKHKMKYVKSNYIVVLSTKFQPPLSKMLHRIAETKVYFSFEL